MDNAETVADEAIERSISHSEIVTLDYDESVVDELRLRADGDAEGNDVLEFWGLEHGDSEWRVHVRTGAEAE